MAKLTCRLAAMAPGLAIPVPLQLLNETIAAYFSVATQGRLRLDLDTSRLHSPLGTNGRVRTFDLHEAVYTLGNKNGPVQTIGVFFADRYAADETMIGLMFDHEFNPSHTALAVTREGCAVFAGAIRARHPNDPAAVAAGIAHATIHELGHVFNLGHVPEAGNLMASSAPSGFAGPFAFCENHRKLLELCDSPQFSRFILPGETAYGTLGPLSGGGDYSLQSLRCPGEIDLHIEMSQSEFWHFEPVELDVVVSAKGGDVTVPDVFDPAYRCFQIWIETPEGERYRYRATKRFCEPSRTRTIPAGRPFRRDVSIFAGAGGYTFREAGLHKVWAVLRTAEGVVRSNTIDVEVKGLPDGGLHDVLTDAANARFLFYRHSRPRRRTVRTLGALMQDRWQEPAAAAIAYAMGCARWAEMLRESKPRRKKVEKTRELLSRAESHRGLSPHRRERAQAMLEQLRAL